MSHSESKETNPFQSIAFSATKNRRSSSRLKMAPLAETPVADSKPAEPERSRDVTMNKEQYANALKREIIREDSPPETFVPRPIDRSSNSELMATAERSNLPKQMDLSQAVDLWLRSADALFKSPEMMGLVMSTQQVARCTGVTVSHVATLPIKLPIGMVQTIMTPKSTRTGCDTSERSRGFVFHALDFVPSIFRTIDELGSTAASIIFNKPMIEEGTTPEPVSRDGMKSGESSQERKDVSGQFQLQEATRTAASCENENNETDETFLHQPTRFDCSAFLLRVDDVGVVFRDQIVSYVDLGSKFGSEDLTFQAMRQLVCHAKDVISSNPYAPNALPKSMNTQQSDLKIEWYPEGETSKHTKKMSKMTEVEQYSYLFSSNILVWSGNRQGSDHSCFMARGIVYMSPRDVLNLLWDFNRAKKYNNHSLGRTDTLVIEDNILDGGISGCKVITSHTKVPFTSFTVQMSVLMHATLLDADNPNEGFMIISRSVGAGAAGCHLRGDNSRNSHVEFGPNEILIGVNVMRPILGEPGLTDLYSASQVRSSVPHFLSKKIGLMGIEDFFKKTNKMVRVKRRSDNL